MDIFSEEEVLLSVPLITSNVKRIRIMKTCVLSRQKKRCWWPIKWIYADKKKLLALDEQQDWKTITNQTMMMLSKKICIAPKSLIMEAETDNEEMIFAWELRRYAFHIKPFLRFRRRHFMRLPHSLIAAFRKH